MTSSSAAADAPRLIQPGPQAPFPNAAVWNGLVFTGGLVPRLDELPLDFDAQAEQVLSALEQTLEQAGSSLERIVRLECFLSGREHFDAWNAAYAGRFGTRPPRTTLVGSFVLDGILIELQAIAAIGSGPSRG